ncbi:MAG: hypothetical protein ACRDY1_08960 [Acidimicrobiales bacterium]
MLHRTQATRVVALLCLAGLFFGGTASASTTFDPPGHGPGPAHIHDDADITPGTIGDVTSVNGTGTIGTCGTAGSSGALTVSGWNRRIDTVTVTPSTTFVEPGTTTPSSADGCVGDVIGAVGTVSGSTVTTAKVYVFPPRTPPTPRGTFGPVTAVDGSTAAGTCGPARSAGTFTVAAWRSAIGNVEVTTSTTFTEPGVSPATFADVCVGEAVGALGTVGRDTVTAAKVYVFPPRTPPVPHGTVGRVTSVNGSTAATSCGTAGTFTVAPWSNDPTTVGVTTTTSFVAPGVSGTSFADLCVADGVGATGAVSGDAVAATSVYVLAPPPATTVSGTTTAPTHGTFGTVSSVNSSTAAATCGTAGAAGAFTVAGFRGTSINVDVSATTAFVDQRTSDPSFADVCVGASVGALGPETGGIVTGAQVFVVPPRTTPAPHPATGFGGWTFGPGTAHAAPVRSATPVQPATAPRSAPTAPGFGSGGFRTRGHPPSSGGDGWTHGGGPGEGGSGYGRSGPGAGGPGPGGDDGSSGWSHSGR